MRNKELTLATLCDGAVNEKVNRALQKAFENVLDPNTDPKKKRAVTLKLILSPNEDDRENVSVEATVSVNLAPETGLKMQFYLNKDLETGGISTVECSKGQIKGQLTFNDYGVFSEDECDPETGEVIEPKVLDMRAARSV